MPDCVNFCLDYHTYTLEWEPYYVTWFVDGKQIFRTCYYYDPSFPPNFDPFGNTCLINPEGYEQSPYFPSFYLNIIANVAVPGSACTDGPFTDPPTYCCLPNSNTLFPKQMDIDYIRVYQQTPQQELSDLCKPIIVGESLICDNSEYVYTAQYPLVNPQNTIKWTVSDNLEILSPPNSTLKIKAKAGAAGAAWVKFSIKGSICSSETSIKIWLGKPKITVTQLGKKCCIRLHADVQGGTFKGWQINDKTYTAPEITLCQTSTNIQVFNSDDEILDELNVLEPNVPDTEAPHQNSLPIYYKASAINKYTPNLVSTSGDVLLCQIPGFKNNITPNPCNTFFTLTLDTLLPVQQITHAYMQNIVTKQSTYYKIETAVQQIQTNNLISGYYLFVLKTANEIMVEPIKVIH